MNVSVGYMLHPKRTFIIAERCGLSHGRGSCAMWTKWILWATVGRRDRSAWESFHSRYIHPKSAAIGAHTLIRVRRKPRDWVDLVETLHL